MSNENSLDQYSAEDLVDSLVFMNDVVKTDADQKVVIGVREKVLEALERKESKELVKLLVEALYL